MNDSPLQYQHLESNIELLHDRMPELPVTAVLISRILLTLGREMSAMLEREIRPFGLAEAEFRVLTTLFAQPEGSAHPSDLCARTSQSPANMSRICDTLVARAVMTRVSSTHDRRKMDLRITDQGETLVRQLLPNLFGPLRDMLADFSVDEQRQLLTQLKRLGTHLTAATPPAVEPRT